MRARHRSTATSPRREQHLARLRVERRAALHRRRGTAGGVRADVREPHAARRLAARDRRRRRRAGCRGGRGGRGARVPGLARSPGRRPTQPAARHRRRDRGAGRRDRVARIGRHRSADSLHVGGREARRREFSLLRGQSARSGARPVAAGARARQLHVAPTARPGRGDHAVEHAVHAVDVEDRAGSGCRLHRRAQAGRVEPASRRRCSPRLRRRPDCRPVC